MYSAAQNIFAVVWPINYYHSTVRQSVTQPQFSLRVVSCTSPVVQMDCIGSYRNYVVLRSTPLDVHVQYVCTVHVHAHCIIIIMYSILYVLYCTV